jgi:malonyl-CoA O-methyltransferase
MSLSNNIISPEDYAKAAALALEVGAEMLARLEWVTLKPKVILEVGCKTGEMSLLLQTRYPDAHIVAQDSAISMLHYAQQESVSYLCAEAGKLPFLDNSIDLIFANLCFPWQNDYPLLLREWHRVLSPDGLVILSALGFDSLQEWRSVINPADMPQLVDMHDIGDLLLAEKFADPVLDVNHYTMTYRNKEKLIHELYSSGMIATPMALSAANVMPDNEGIWHITYEVIYAHAFAPAKTNEVSASADGIVRIPLSRLRRQLK